MSRRHKLPVASRQWAIVHRKLHLNRRRIEFHKRHRFSIDAVAERFADGKLLDPGDSDDVTGFGHDTFARFQTAEFKNFRDHGLVTFPVFVDADDRIAHLAVAARHLADRDPADIIAPVEIADQHLEGRIPVRFRR